MSVEKVKREDIISNWFKYNNLKELAHLLGYADHGALSRRAETLGLPKWSKRISYLYSKKCENE